MVILKTGSTLQVGKYKIINTLGQGGFGITYLAEQTMLDRKVAIKEFFMKEFCERDEQTKHVTLGTEGSRETVRRFREKFLKEARNMAKLKHPNIVRIIDVFEENGTAYYVMEYCENGSLTEKVKEQGSMSESVATCYIIQVAEALDYTHQRKMNHLDIKPSNIMLNEKNDVVLIDFGLSKQYNISGQQTSTTPVGISEGYAPMEQYKQGGVGEFSPETDIYALGATFFKLLTGVTPPSASDVYEDGVPVDELKAKGVSQKAINVICKAMEPRKRDRMKDVRSFINGLQKELVSISLNEDEATVPFVVNKRLSNERKCEVGKSIVHSNKQINGGSPIAQIHTIPDSVREIEIKYVKGGIVGINNGAVYFRVGDRKGTKVSSDIEYIYNPKEFANLVRELRWMYLPSQKRVSHEESTGGMNPCLTITLYNEKGKIIKSIYSCGSEDTCLGTIAVPVEKLKDKIANVSPYYSSLFNPDSTRLIGKIQRKTSVTKYCVWIGIAIIMVLSAIMIWMNVIEKQPVNEPKNVDSTYSLSDDNVSDHSRVASSDAASSVSSPDFITISVKNGIDIEMVKVEAGSFDMGATSEQSDPCTDEKPVHRVTLTNDYYIGRYEVTQNLWKTVMGENPSKFRGNSNLPVEQVNWDDCQKFIFKLNRLTGRTFRLPTEAEWEYAARGGKKSSGYKYCGSNTIGDVGWYCDNSQERTHVVGLKQPNELEIYDMSGNVMEWCYDWYGAYSSSSKTNPIGTVNGERRVCRGGGLDVSDSACRQSSRFDVSPDCRSWNLGLRLVITE